MPLVTWLRTLLYFFHDVFVFLPTVVLSPFLRFFHRFHNVLRTEYIPENIINHVSISKFDYLFSLLSKIKIYVIIREYSIINRFAT